MGGVGQSTGWGGFVSCKNRFPGALACRGSDGEGWKCDFFLKLDSTRLLKTCWVLSLRYEEWSININRISVAIGHLRGGEGHFTALLFHVYSFCILFGVT